MSQTLSDIINQVNKIVATYWPLQSFIASNPLWDMTDKSFATVCDELADHVPLYMGSGFYKQAYYNDDITDDDIMCALEQMELNDQQANWFERAHAFLEQPATPLQQPILLCEQIDSFNYQPPLTWIQQQVNFWLLQYFGELTQAQDASITLFEYWQTYMIHEHKSLAQLKKFEQPLSALAFLIEQLQIPDDVLLTYLTRIICHQYGWASLIKWAKQRPDNPWIPPVADIASLFCIWLSYEWLVCLAVLPNQEELASYYKSEYETYRSTQIAMIWQLAYENHQHQQLIDQLLSVKPNSDDNNKPEAQFIFCIDVRSEPIRRHIEALGHYETYGFAGFFGFAFKRADEYGYRYQCPALLDPDTVVQVQSTNQRLLKQISPALLTSINSAKNHLTSPYALFEMVGIYKIIHLIKKTFLNQHATDKPSYSSELFDLKMLSFDEAAKAGYQLLNTIGLTQSFANDVIICAHQSMNENNPFAAALDCGACGGNSGIPNALIAATYLNQPEVRQRIAQMGIAIPESTTFIAGCHYTTHDEVKLFTQPNNSKIPLILERACVGVRAEKSGHFVYHENNQLLKKQNDWAELVPELGLANNYALIVGPRRFTQGFNFNGRVFLHSYEPSQDEEGDILTDIVSAPVIVAHWINAQYYFSTVAPKQFGAGNKAIHNVIPHIGVMEGNLSDLKIGLPQQSISYKNQLVHQPVRLLVVIYGDRQIINRVIARNPTVKQLIDGLWVKLKIIDSA